MRSAVGRPLLRVLCSSVLVAATCNVRCNAELLALRPALASLQARLARAEKVSFCEVNADKLASLRARGHQGTHSPR